MARQSGKPARTPSEAVLARRELAIADSDERRSELAMRAYRMRIAGATWWDIAEELKLTEDVVTTLVSERLRAAASLYDEGSKRTMMAAELERLDRLQSAVWANAMSGDAKAVDAALKVIDRRIKLLGLDEAVQANITANTIVVPGSSADYVAALRGVVTREIAS